MPTNTRTVYLTDENGNALIDAHGNLRTLSFSLVQGYSYRLVERASIVSAIYAQVVGYSTATGQTITGVENASEFDVGDFGIVQYAISDRNNTIGYVTCEVTAVGTDSLTVNGIGISVSGKDGDVGSQGHSYFRVTTTLTQDSTSVQSSFVQWGDFDKALISDTIVDNDGNVFAVTAETEKTSPSVPIAYRTSIKGAKGATGEGVPAGGTAGQVLKKSSNSDYSTEWGEAEQVTKEAVAAALGITSAQVNQLVALSKVLRVTSNKVHILANVEAISFDEHVIYDDNDFIYTSDEEGVVISGLSEVGATKLSSASGVLDIPSMIASKKVVGIGSSAFYNKPSVTDVLTLVTIPDGVTSIGDEAFRNCSSLEYVNIPDSVTSIGDSAFTSCKSLEYVNIPDGVTNIAFSTFGYCTGLTSITIPDSVTSIENSAFSHCTSLTSITIPDSVTSIKNSAFSHCTSLTSITIHDSVKFINAYAFDGCGGLTSVAIGNGVTSIGDYAFRDCTSLTSIAVPDSVTSIGEYAFSNCSSLEHVNIPDGVTDIEWYTFEVCTSLTAVTIGNGVTSIGTSAFRRCTGLTSITVPDSVTTIWEYAFSNCSNLMSFSYEGTMAQWTSVTKRETWNNNCPFTVVHCSDGDVAVE